MCGTSSSPPYIHKCSPGLMVTRHSETVNKSECMSQPEAKEKGSYLPLQTALPTPKAYRIPEFFLTFRDRFPSFCSLYLSMSSSPGSSVHGDSPGRNTGVGCHALLQGIFPTQELNQGPLLCRQIRYQLSYQKESEVAQSCPTLRDPMDCSLPGSSVHGIFQARVLEWGAIAFSVDDITWK